jgi:CoA-substrate-specific enzyme activase, putative
MYFCGIDIGSLTTKVVIIDEEDIVGYRFTKSGINPRGIILNLYEDTIRDCGIDKRDVRFITATGYGRNVATAFFADEKVTEITCHAKGVRKIFPDCHTVIDIGGQDSKAMRLDENGRVRSFAMNDKCAAGSGRFLEVMANALGINIEDMGPLSLKSKNRVAISSTCTVFAESEVVSLIAAEKDKEDIIAGLHDAIATRVSGLAKNVGIEDEVVMTGGVAKNVGMVRSFERKIGHTIYIPPEPLITGALGAALISREKFLNRKSREL